MASSPKSGVAELKSGDKARRDYATWALGRMGDRATRVLIKALSDPSAIVRRHAAIALASLGSAGAEAAAKLAELRKDANPGVKLEATIAWIRVQVSPSRLPKLLEQLDSKDWGVRLAAVDVIGQIGREARGAAPALHRLLLSDAEDLDLMVVRSIPRAGTQRLNLRRSLVLALAKIGPVEGVDAVSVLLGLRRHKSPHIREAVLIALRSFKTSAGTLIPRVIEAMDDPSWDCRRAALTTLRDLSAVNSEHVASLVEVGINHLPSSNPSIQRLACELLGDLGASAGAAVPKLGVALKSSSVRNRMWAARALQKIGKPAKAMVPQLVAGYRTLADTESGRPWERREARNAILDALVVLDPENSVGFAPLAERLASNESKANPGRRREQAIRLALAALETAQGEERVAAIRSLGQWRATEAIPALLPLLNAKEPEQVRGWALRALMEMDATAMVPLLRPMLEAEEAGLRQSAAFALAMFDDPQSRDAVVRYFTKRISIVSKDSLVMIGLTGIKDLAPSFESILRDPEQSSHRHWGAAVALGQLGRKGSVKELARFVRRVEADDKAQLRDRMELIEVALRSIAWIDPSTQRQLFVKYAESDEKQVRDAAMHGLVALRDPATRKKLVARGDYGRAFRYLLEPDLLRKLTTTRLRLSQVKGCTLADVMARFSKKLGIEIELGASVDRRVLEGVFVGYIEFAGYRPSALSVLGAFGRYTFTGGVELKPVFGPKKILLLPEAEALREYEKALKAMDKGDGK